LGCIGVHWSRPLAGTPKTVTISHEADGWYIAISCADVPVDALPPTGQETGLDLGVESFAPLAHGACICTPASSRKAEAHGRRCQRRVARRVSRRGKGRQRRRRAVALLARAHQHMRRQRTDFQHQTALALVRAYDTIGHDEVRVATRVQTHSFAKSSSAAGGSAFLAILACKAASAGKRVVAVDPAFSSQRCSGCGVMVQNGLSVRGHCCPECGTSLHRDQNAARTILRLGQSQAQNWPGYRRQASTWPVGASLA
ncbi:MAG TPA: transposase, partial [Ktedonobacterales bacterium]|nr:transposase [Ktedonobacterales bacterium]